MNACNYRKNCSVMEFELSDYEVYEIEEWMAEWKRWENVSDEVNDFFGELKKQINSLAEKIVVKKYSMNYRGEVTREE